MPLKPPYFRWEPRLLLSHVPSAPNDDAEKYQKITREAINKFVVGARLVRRTLPFRKVAHHGELEHLALQSLHHEDDPNCKKRERDHHRNQQDKQPAERWNEKQSDPRNPQHRADNQGRKA
jgi:hypothetical protein